MTATLIKQQMREIMAVGTSLDPLLDGFIERAVQDFEDSINLFYMRKTETAQVSAGAREIIPASRMKEPVWVRYYTDTDQGRRFTQLSAVQEWQVALTGVGEPTFFYRADEQTLVVDKAPVQPLDIVVLYWAYSDFPLADNAPVLVQHTRPILYRAIYEAAPSARKPELGDAYLARYNEAMTKLQLRADEAIHTWAEVYMGGSQ